MNIPTNNLRNATNKLEKLQRRAAKLGFEVKWTQSAPFVETVDGHPVQFVNITVDAGNYFKISGWEFVCKVSRTPNGKHIYSFPRFSNMDQLHETIQFDEMFTCEHCNINRHRIDVFLLYNAQEQVYKMVGRNCLGSFLGVDVSRILTLYTYLENLDNSLLDDEEYDFDSEPKHKQLYNVQKYMQAVLYCAKENGFITKKLADTSLLLSTSAHAKEVYNSVKIDLTPFATEAKEMISGFVQNYEGYTSNYLENLYRMVSEEYCEGWQLGIVASLYLAAKPKSDKESFGVLQPDYTEKEKLSDLDVVFIRGLEQYSQYGPKTMQVFHSNTSDEIYIWWDTTNNTFESGENLILSGTVKSVQQYNGQWQTTLLRCKTK